MKRILSALLCAALLLPLAAAGSVCAAEEEFAASWEFTSGKDSFQANNSTLDAADGKLIQTVSGEKHNTWLLSPNNLGIDAAKYPVLHVSVKNSTGAKGSFAFEAIGSEKEKFTGAWCSLGTIPNDGAYHEYTVDLSAFPDWQGLITRFRLRLTAWQTEGSVEVDYIRLGTGTKTDKSDEPAEPSALVSFVSEVPASFTVFRGAQYEQNPVKAQSYGQYSLPAGVYTYTAAPNSAGYSKIHRTFRVTEEDVKAGAKIITVSLPAWKNPGYWQVKTIYLPSEEITSKYFTDPLPSLKLQTPAAAADRPINAFTTQEELDAFMKQADDAAENMWSTVIGTAEGGLNIHLAVFSRGAENNGKWTDLASAADALRKLGKPIVWISAQVHGNEWASGESALQMINELSGSWGDKVLDTVSVVILPRQNPAGAQYNRRTPDGSLDINRDRVKTELTETRAIQNAYWLFTPEVCVDAHEYGATPALYKGTYTYAAYDLLISASTNRNTSDALRDMARTMYQDSVHKSLSEYGIRTTDYYDGGIQSTVTEKSPNPQTNADANSLYPAFSFLIETLIPGGGYNSLAHFDRRVKSHVLAAKEIIEITAENAAEVMQFLTEERTALLRAGESYDEDDVIVLSQAAKTVKKDFSYIDLANGTLTSAEIEYKSYTEGSVTKTIPRPTGYILPKTDAMQTAVDRLRIMGVEMTELPAGTSVEDLEKYTVTANSVSTSETQGAYLNTVKVSAEKSAQTFADGAYLIPMNQIRANLIAAALEPECAASFVSYRLIDASAVSSGESLPYYRYTGTALIDVHTDADADADVKPEENPAADTSPAQGETSGKFPILAVGAAAVIIAAAAGAVVIGKKKRK